MSQEKRPRGRSRKYETNAERKKAYRERKKAERIELEKRVVKLEKQLEKTDHEVASKKITSDPILSLTFNEIMKTDTEILQTYVTSLKKELGDSLSLYSPLSIIIENIIGSLEPIVSTRSLKISPNQIISLQVDKQIDEFEESLKQLTLLHIIELELGHRENDSIEDYELEILERRIDELEKEVVKKKERKVSSKIITNER
ncbi:MAG: hypothetical protein HZR80_17855 [Candidatus Heimdallarchaeota archaeon]